MQQLTIDQIATAIEHSKPDEQRRLLARLPQLLGMSVDDLGWTKLAESPFRFWDNEDDTVYDSL